MNQRLSDAGLVAALRHEAGADRVVAPAGLDFAVMRAVRDTAPVFPGLRGRERSNAMLVAGLAACCLLVAVVSVSTLPVQIAAVRAAGERLSGVAKSAEDLAQRVRPPSLPMLPRFGAPSGESA